MKFTKMQVNGNDFIVIDAINEKVPEDYSELAKELTNRKLGIGSDGFVVILKSDKADILVKIFNPDGSEPWISSNDILCASKYAFDNKIVANKKFKVETRARVVEVRVENEELILDMGEPILETKKIPAVIDKEKMVNEQIKLKDRIIRATCLSMGSPHCVIFVDKVALHPVEEEGPLIEDHEGFPRRTNVEFIQVLDENEVQMRVWERGGVGEVLCSGTGACAVVVAGVLNKKTGRKLTVHSPGGDLDVEWRESDNHVILKAKPQYVFKGEIER